MQEKQKGKKMTNWNEGEKGPLDYSSKSDNNTNGGDKVEDLSMNQYVNVIYFYFNQEWKLFVLKANFFFSFKERSTEHIPRRS